MDDPALILASASPRRRELLARVGLRLAVAPVDVDEAVLVGESPDAYLERVVEEKRVAAAGHEEGLLVADTSVIVGDDILGKPADDEEAAEMIRRLAGSWHRVATRFCLDHQGRRHAETVSTQVRFRALDEEEVRAYAATGEGKDKAGAYGIQGIGAMLVERIEGSYTNVVGLPLAEVVVAMRALELWQRYT